MASKPKPAAQATEPFVSAAAFFRPPNNTPYSPGDRVGSDLNGLKIGGVFRAGRGPVRITRLVLRKSSAGIFRARFRVHLFRAPPICPVLDGEVLASSGEMSVETVADYIGAALVPMDSTARHGAAGAGRLDFEGFVVRPTFPDPEAAALYALVEALDHYSPTPDENFVLELEGVRALNP